jgi:hypothetical protein
VRIGMRVTARILQEPEPMVVFMPVEGDAS